MRANNFYEDLKFVLSRQYNTYREYRRLCEDVGISLNNLVNSLDDKELMSLPSINSDFCKLHKSNGIFKRISNLNLPGKWLVSSSSGGDPSYRWSTKDDMQVIINSYKEAFKKVPRGDITLSYGPNISFLKKAAKRFLINQNEVDLFALYPNYAVIEMTKKIDYLLKTSGTTSKLALELKDVDNILKNLEKNGIVVLGGSVLLLYQDILRQENDFNFGNDIYILTGAGGWNGAKGIIKGEPIDKPTYVEILSKKFGILNPEEQIVDTYGTTENGKAQAGFYSKYWEDFIFDVNNDVIMLVIDPISGELAKKGEKGIPRFISPYGVEGYAGAIIDQDDVVTVVSTYKDGSVKQFTHISRISDITDIDKGKEDGCALDLFKYIT